MRSNRQYGPYFRFIRGVVRLFYPRYTIQVPDHQGEPTVYISHHQNLFGPFVVLLWFPRVIRTWILDVFFDQMACYTQYVDYTFTERYGWNKTFAKIAAYPLSFGISKLLQSGQGIPVYRGSKKIIKTIHESVVALEKGEPVIIFPDIDYSDTSSDVKDLYEGFLYLEKYYNKKTGKHIRFVPMYVSKSNRTIVTGTPICFPGENDFQHERQHVYDQIHEQLKALAR